MASATNLLPRRLSEEEIVSCAGHFGLTYNILEGGYISPDKKIIIISDRAPYNGLMMYFRHEEATRDWAKDISEYVLENFQ